MFNNIIYAGNKECECLGTKYLKTITLFGSGLRNNSSLNKKMNLRLNINSTIHNSPIVENFFVKEIAKAIYENPNAKLCFYDKLKVLSLPPLLQEFTTFQPTVRVLNSLRYKSYFMETASTLVDTASRINIKGCNIDFDDCRKLLGGKKFLIQNNDLSKTEPTLILAYNNIDKILAKIVPSETYCVSVYDDFATPVNMQVLISDTNIFYFPGASQINKFEEEEMRLVGYDFLSFELYPNEWKDLLEIHSIAIAEEVQRMGYRGICGLEFSCRENGVTFENISFSFQPITLLLNIALKDRNLPTVNELDAMCYTQDKLPQIFYFKVNYSCLFVRKEDEKKLPDLEGFQVKDGFIDSELTQKNAYLYTMVYEDIIP